MRETIIRSFFAQTRSSLRNAEWENRARQYIDEIAQLQPVYHGNDGGGDGGDCVDGDDSLTLTTLTTLTVLTLTTLTL